MTIDRIARLGLLTLMLAGLTAACGGEKAATAGDAPSTAAATASDGGADASTASSATTGNGTIDIESAKQVVGDLWAARQVEISEEDEDGFAAVESGPVLHHDVASAIQVNCKCEPPRSLSKLDHILVSPASIGTDSILAELYTNDVKTGEGRRYVVVAERTSGAWKLALVTYDNDDPTGEHSVIEAADSPAIETTAADRKAGTKTLRRAVTEVRRWYATGRPLSAAFARGDELAKYQKKGKAHADHTVDEDGAAVRILVELRPADGVHVFRLTTTRLVTCGTMHELLRYIAEPGAPMLQQAGSMGWGPLLEPGIYETMTMDFQTMTCIVDTGAEKTPFTAVGDYYAMVAETGTSSTAGSEAG